ncbi:MAG: precorrin-8X methylmutase [Thermodesulfobacteriota bacterium]|nr:precorrin-8X methylmutase [Thermodesulfobacteriota bacterium]
MNKGTEIEKRSFEIIAEKMRGREFEESQRAIVMRVIHATGDFDFEDNLKFHPRAIEAGIMALKSGKDILVDVNMVAAGINRQLLARFGGDIISKIAEVGNEAVKERKTRAEVAIQRAMNQNVGIVAIGNAPTALFKAIELIDKGGHKPCLVIGVPVGFVNAEESKEALSKKSYPFITSLGRKGGSHVAVAIVNGILRLAVGYEFDFQYGHTNQDPYQHV